MKYEIYKDKQGLWRWRVIARNGRIIAESGEGYTRRARCLDGLHCLIEGIWTGELA
ncbi:MAG: YegP family protein [Alphaproteobacteria bacterium]